MSVAALGTSGPGTAATGPIDWQRLHPLTPLLRAGRFLFLAIVLVGQNLVRTAPPLVSAGIILVALPLGALYGYLSWRYTRWALDGDDLRIENGVLFRQSRRVPLARLQAVDVVRGIVARALGLAELRLEVVGGGDSEGRLAYLSADDTDQVRDRLLAASRAAEARGAGGSTTHGPGAGGAEAAGPGAEGAPPSASGAADAADAHTQDAPAPDEPLPERTLVAVPTGPLLASIALSLPVVAALVALVVALVAVVVVGPEVLVVGVPALIPLGLGLVASVASQLQRGYGFTLTSGRDGLRLRHGLLETRSQTVPRGRVQAVRLTEPFLWRRAGWARVEVDVAGYGGGGEQQQVSATLLPVGPKAYARTLAGLALDGLDLDAVTLSRPPRRARWLAPLQWPRLGVGATPDHLVTTAGWVTARTVALPWVKVQSLRLRQGPLDRRLGLSTLYVDTAGRFLFAEVPHRPDAEALAMLDSGAELSRRARTVDLRAGIAAPPRVVAAAPLSTSQEPA